MRVNYGHPSGCPSLKSLTTKKGNQMGYLRSGDEPWPEQATKQEKTHAQLVVECLEKAASLADSSVNKASMAVVEGMHHAQMSRDKDLLAKVEEFCELLFPVLFEQRGDVLKRAGTMSDKEFQQACFDWIEFSRVFEPITKRLGLSTDVLLYTSRGLNAKRAAEQASTQPRYNRSNRSYR